MLRFILYIPIMLFAVVNTTAQTTRSVLFLGNSYTASNNLPQLIQNAAISTGDTLIYDSHTPGGYTLADHSANATSQAKIETGGWDYVVMQGQSQEPVVQSSVFYGGGIELNGMISEFNPCAVPMLYMTWGRKNGDATTCPFFPEMCTYESMDDALKERYLNLAGYIDAEVSPVSVVWRNLRNNHPDIELYTGDESHPSAAGSYAAACSFYAAIFKKDPMLITFDFSLNATDAAIIRNVAKTEVFDALELWDYKQLPQSDFQYSIGSGNNEVVFSQTNFGIVQTFFWDFGDGNTSDVPSPTHSYGSNGTYTVTLTTSNCDLDGFHTSTTDTIIQFCEHTPTIFSTNPWLCENDTLWTQSADAYQWFSGEVEIPQTGPYLANYQQYNTSGFSVLVTVDGCSELSQVFSANPEWSGYYFDSAMGGDPCVGDTALFTVHHIDGFLSGSEMIRWYKNDTLLPLMNDEDTLFITIGGVYECFVVNPDSDCPTDTTSATTEFDCGIVSLTESSTEEWLRLYPNPASESISVEYIGARSTRLARACSACEAVIQMYTVTGHLVKEFPLTGKTTIGISDLPRGLYFLRLKNKPGVVERFVKI